MMTLEQTIEHCKQISDTCDIEDTAKQYSQLTEWLDELRKYKQNGFIEFNAYTRDPHNLQTVLISIRKNEILQFFSALRGFGNAYTTCTRIITNKGDYDIKENYNEVKEKLL